MKLVALLPGGGAAGSVQIGIIKAFQTAGIIPTEWHGISAGGLNSFGIGIAGIDKTIALWDSINNEDAVFNGHWYIQDPWEPGLKDASPLRAKLQSLYNEAKGLPLVSFEVTACNLTTESTEYFQGTDPNIVNWTVAGASIPGYVDPYTAPNGNYYVDGGTLEYSPLTHILSQPTPPDGIIIFPCYPTDSNPALEGWKLSNPIATLLRASDAIVQTFMEQDLKLIQTRKDCPPIFIAAPQAVVVNDLEFDPNDITLGINYGLTQGAQLVGSTAFGLFRKQVGF